MEDDQGLEQLPLDAPQGEETSGVDAAQTEAGETNEPGGSLRTFVEEAELADEDTVYSKDGEYGDFGDYDEEERSEKPIKGPSAFSWILALALMLLALPALGLFAGNAVLSFAALSGFLHEKTGYLYSAMDDYQALTEWEATVESTRTALFSFGGTSGKIGFSTGNFANERQLMVINAIAGPLQSLQYYEAWFPEGTPVPRSMRKMTAQMKELQSVTGALDNLLQNSAGPEEGQDQTQWLLAMVDQAQAEDKNADKYALYYDTLRLYYEASEGAGGEKVKRRIEALKNAPGSEPWMYEEMAIINARESGDYKAVIALCEARARRNHEDSIAAEYTIKALYLDGQKEEAYQEAEALIKSKMLGNAAKLTKAELLYREKKYGDAIKLCNEVIAKTQGDENESASLITATTVKAVTLLLSGDAKGAAALLQDTLDNPPGQLDYPFAYACLIAANAAKDDAFYQSVASLMEAIPEQITDLQAGKLSAEDIYVKGWGELQ
ncbi:MAG: hypothetical protein LBQ33_03300 [Oscillospiraceae bacterium]|nr:hypothetical protein [Oscillospiraceae bacterium]